MAELDASSDSTANTAEGTGGGPDPGSEDGTPRWVKVFVIVGVVLVVLFVVLKVSGVMVGGHGPGRHMPSPDAGADTSHERHSPPEEDRAPPADGHR